ncbi:arginine/lysine/ornithine decarboxylases [Candidatus Gastranaerophilus sp. (ex Termes propinquus)]|nr:arginine/lysine/ornithine decarboxylases [Candidatus Gastranaerophilus sp. (ex Termes propinquus)]
MQPYQAFGVDYSYVSKKDALLKLSADTVIPYPPCSGVLFPGEAIQEWHLNYLQEDVKILKV